MKKNKILILTTIEGHLSIAEAIKEYLEENGSLTKLIITEDIAFSFYRIFYKFNPKLYKYIHKILDNENFNKIIEKYKKVTYNKKVKETIQSFKPDLTIITHSSFEPALNDTSINTKPFINIIANPRKILNFELSKTTFTNCIFDKKQETLINKNNGNQYDLSITGWFVRPKFEEKYNQNKVRKKLKLNQNQFTILFVSGSEGTNSIISDILLLLNHKQSCQIIIACGKNKLLLKSLKTLNRLTINKESKIIPLSFTNELHLYMQASNLIIGKAGPNTIFESVATNTPFFATTHMSGLEDGNLRIIKKYKIGLIEENSIKAINKLKQIIANPSSLEKYQPHLNKLAKYNAQSKTKLMKIIKKLL